ncbi:MAG: nucleotide pyrophosphohydrolase [Candidatus Omnitrophica bacterium]|nr:nucleotide pyrophosphohydrolase [Candidatus Omnitrophota bacterium]
MSDGKTTVRQLKTQMKAFVRARGWEEFHAPKNITMSLAIEAAELMEHFQWLSVEESRAVKNDPMKMEHIKDEVADVMSYLLSLCNVLEIDLSGAIKAKMVKNNKKYPPKQATTLIHRYTYSKRAR